MSREQENHRHHHPHHSHREAQHTPTGDDMANDIHAHLNSYDTDLSRVAEFLVKDHERRPSQYPQDLGKVNTALHDQRILPSVDIVGVQGQDFVTRDREDHSTVRRYDSRNINYNYPDNGGIDDRRFGRHQGEYVARADGSGTYTVAAKDNSYSIAGDILKHQGIQSPSETDKAAFQRQIAYANPDKDLAKLYVGDELKIPAITGRFDNIPTDRQSIYGSYDAANHILDKYSHTLYLTQNHISAERLNNLLNSSIPEEDRRGLQFMSRNFEALKDRSSIVFNGQITQESLDAWKADQVRHIDDRRYGRNEHY